MRYKIPSKIIIVLVYLLFFNSFAQGEEQKTSTYHRIQPYECRIVPANGFVKKVDNFMLIFDPSASMTEPYQASNECTVCHLLFADYDYSKRHNLMYETQPSAKNNPPRTELRCAKCHQDYLYSKFNFAKDLTKCFNQDIPDLDLTCALRLFGSPVYTMRSYGPKKYAKDEFDHELRKLLDADGTSPLDMTLKAAGKDWFNSTGKIAVVVISDGKDMDEREILAAEELKTRYEERICIYTILIGGDQNGEEVMRKIAQAGQCGMAVNGDTLLDKNKMADFTKDIFLTEAPPIVQQEVKAVLPVDNDGDGVIDANDDCPDTKPGLTVDYNGCWKLIMAADVLFDFDKYVFTPEGTKAMNQVNDFMQKYPFLDLAISGHTDNFGSMKYNIALSKKRAVAGLNYLVRNGIEKERISLSWHSFSMPRATNETVMGRALNRRLEFTFSKHE